MPAQAFILENIPVTMTDVAIRSSIEREWGPMEQIVRMRFLDAKARSGRPTASVSTGKVLFTLNDPSLLQSDVVPRCRKGHRLCRFTEPIPGKCCCGDCRNRFITNYCFECNGREGRESDFLCCDSCLLSNSRTPIKVSLLNGMEVILKVKKARGGITHAKRQSQLFIHAFPIEVGSPDPSQTRLQFASVLSQLLGHDIDLSDKCRTADDEVGDRQLLDIDLCVEAKGLYVSNLVALTLAHLFVTPTVLQKSSVQQSFRLVEKIKYFVLDQSPGSMRPRPFCFFLEMNSDDAAEEMKQLFHDVILTVDNPSGSTRSTMLFDVQFRGEEKVKRGTLLEQNKTVPGRKYAETSKNSVLQVRKFMDALLSGQPLSEVQLSSVSQSAAGLNTEAKPFRPGGGGMVPIRIEMPIPPMAPDVMVGLDEMAAVDSTIVEIMQLTEENELLRAHVANRQAPSQNLNLDLLLLRGAVDEYEREAKSLKNKVKSMMINRELELIGRKHQIAVLMQVASQAKTLLSPDIVFNQVPDTTHSFSRFLGGSDAYVLGRKHTMVST